MSIDTGHDGPADATRRDFVVLVTGAMGAVAVVASIIPLIESMNPSADTIAAGAPVEFDVSQVKPGEQVIASWRGRPIFVVHRTGEELSMLQQARDTNLLSDPKSTNLQQPPYAQNWHRSINPEYLVVVGICTHLGCIPGFQPKIGSVDANWPGGYLCPCHGSKYDLSGRVFSGVPAPYNLPVPPYHFVEKGVIRIGENPPGVQFSFADILQI